MDKMRKPSNGGKSQHLFSLKNGFNEEEWHIQKKSTGFSFERVEKKETEMTKKVKQLSLLLVMDILKILPCLLGMIKQFVVDETCTSQEMSSYFLNI